MKISADHRYYIHGFRDDHKVDTQFQNTRLNSAIEEFEGILKEHIETGSTEHHDRSLYTGDLGVLFALYGSDLVKFRRSIRGRSASSSRPPTLLGGEMMLAVVQVDIKAIRHFAEEAARLPSAECEILYGRAGCLLGLLRLSRNSGEIVHEGLMLMLIRQIISAGEGHDPTLLMWQWHGKHYLGAIHGVAGILMTLLLCPPAMIERAGPNVMSRIEYTVDTVLARYIAESGNIRSSTESSSDRLVHFCHGATGWIPLLCLMSERFPRRRVEFMERAKTFGGIVWQRGLLATKGPGLCHGVSGSICALLDLYRCSKDDIWYTRAKLFAEFLANEWRSLLPKADRSFSLFEGLAGAYYAIVLVRDERHVGQLDGFHSVFPCF